MDTRASILSAFAVVLGVAALAQAGAANGSTRPKAPKADIAAVVNSGQAFAVDLYAKLASKEGNLFFSPGSIDTALAMTYAGAAGATADQMTKTLHLTLPADKLHPAFATMIRKLNHPRKIDVFDDSGNGRGAPAYELTVANALWGQKGFAFKADFTKLLEDSYGAAMNGVDYANPDAARETINAWVAKQTKDKIKDLIAQGVLTPDTRLVLTNAVYFKSNWAEKFEKDATKDGAFKLSADKSVDVPMMHQVEELGYAEDAIMQTVELPYMAQALSMVILLPKKADGLAGIEKALTAENLDRWQNAVKSTQVDLTMPKFKFASEFGLADTLKAMGMTDAFDPLKADFSGMTAEKKLFISAVIHKAFVAVDEEGTEAAAATAMDNSLGANRPEEPKVVKADHPFIFLIRHNATSEILFLGRLANPKQ